MPLHIKNFSVSVEDKAILDKVSLSIDPGTVHVIMGPNGSGKSTLANSLMGHPKYTVTNGTVTLDDTDITELSVEKKAKAGLFLSMQYLPEVEGVRVTHFLRTAVQAVTGTKQNPIAFLRSLKKKMADLGIDESFASREVNVGFSGGEKKRLEVLQLLTLAPKYAILDETDSGLDVDALKAVAEGIEQCREEKTGVLLITHYNRILEYVRPDVVHIMKDGHIVQSGNKELAAKIEKYGYANPIDV